MYKTFDIFYPWTPNTGRSPLESGTELIYSVRSVARYLVPQLGKYQRRPRIWIATEYPHLVPLCLKRNAGTNGSCKVNIVQVPRLRVPCKERQIKLAIETVIANGISDPFLYINDDQYLVSEQAIDWIHGTRLALESETDVNQLIAGLRNAAIAHSAHPAVVHQRAVENAESKTEAQVEVSAWYERHNPLNIDYTQEPLPDSSWQQVMIYTLLKLQIAGRSAHNWCTHTPLLIGHADYKRALEFFGHHRMWQLESGILNLANDFWPVFLSDVPGLRVQLAGKLSPHSESAIPTIQAHTAFLNHTDDGAVEANELLRRIFPTPAKRYESP